jgi:hypothetical protein
MQSEAYQPVGSLRPAGPGGPAAATSPASLDGAHSRRAADPSDTSLVPKQNSETIRPKSEIYLKQNRASGTMKPLTSGTFWSAPKWHKFTRPLTEVWPWRDAGDVNSMIPDIPLSTVSLQLKKGNHALVRGVCCLS